MGPVGTGLNAAHKGMPADGAAVGFVPEEFAHAVHIGNAAAGGEVESRPFGVDVFFTESGNVIGHNLFAGIGAAFKTCRIQPFSGFIKIDTVGGMLGLQVVRAVEPLSLGGGILFDHIDPAGKFIFLPVNFTVAGPILPEGVFCLSFGTFQGKNNLLKRSVLGIVFFVERRDIFVFSGKVFAEQVLHIFSPERPLEIAFISVDNGADTGTFFSGFEIADNGGINIGSRLLPNSCPHLFNGS